MRVSETITRLKSDVPSKNDHQVLSFQFHGYIILIGQNAFSNERLVSDHPHRQCYWMHAMAAAGSHVILCSNGKADPTDDVIQHAAKLALRHSHSQASTVSMAILKDIFKPEGYGMGVFKVRRSVPVEVL